MNQLEINYDTILNEFSKKYPQGIIADGLNKAIIGYSVTESGVPFLIYSMEKCIEAEMENNNWEYDEAEEWLGFNAFNAYVGEGTPIFISEFDEVEN